ncbi:MAG TPA: hypothetical protein VM243_16825 [Phycisphaerae bacterium]|nr:hypothetical protein [Phycisphaerae bacterium]
MCGEFSVLPDIIQHKPPTRMKPREFFIAWCGVATLAYRGFSRVLSEIKQEIQEKIPGIKHENPGSRWPKTTLGALRDDVTLSWDDLDKLRRICDELNGEIGEYDKPLDVAKLSIVVFQCRSLEKRLLTFPVPLSGQHKHQDDEPSPEHLAQVQETMACFSRDRLLEYWPHVQREGNRESHYRTTHIESTLVFDLKATTMPYVDLFMRKVDAQLPGRYCWFGRESRHLTVRALVST